MKPKLMELVGLILLLNACREPFDADPSTENLEVLVVEDYLDTEGVPSLLKINRTVPISVDSVFSPETGAKVILSSSSGLDIPLSEVTPCSYYFENDVDESDHYRLEIVLANGDRFESSEIIPIRTPEIFDAGFVKDTEGVEVYLTTQGNEDSDDFLWTFEETWVFRPYTFVPFIYDLNTKSVRTRSEEAGIFNCYKSEPNPEIILETSSRFQDQVIFRQTITEIPTGNERIQFRYNILISQKGIPSNAVNFWETLKRNTEDIGSIFSPLPSIITGNISSLDTDTPVIGQINMGIFRQKRIYINRVEVAPWPYENDLFKGCLIDPSPILLESSEFHLFFKDKLFLPAREYLAGSSVVGYYPQGRPCADCTLYADPNKPDFWEDE